MEAVFQHYNEDRQRSDKNRVVAIALNATKISLLDQHSGRNVADWGAGHGADVGHYPSRIESMQVCDLCENQLKSFEDRFNRRKHTTNLNVSYVVWDFTTEPTFPVLPVDSINLGLSAHFSCYNKQTATQFLKNVASFLIPRGIAMLTVPDSGFIVWALRVHFVATLADVSTEVAELAFIRTGQDCRRSVEECDGIKPWDKEGLAARCGVTAAVAKAELSACGDDAEAAGFRLAWVVNRGNTADFRVWLDATGYSPRKSPVFHSPFGNIYNFETGYENGQCPEPLMPFSHFSTLARSFGLQCVCPLDRSVVREQPMSVVEYLREKMQTHTDIFFDMGLFKKGAKVSAKDFNRIRFYCCFCLVKTPSGR